MSDEERELVNAAERDIAQGREPTGEARAMWLKIQGQLHHGSDPEQQLRSRVNEAVAYYHRHGFRPNPRV